MERSDGRKRQNCSGSDLKDWGEDLNLTELHLKCGLRTISQVLQGEKHNTDDHTI